MVELFVGGGSVAVKIEAGGGGAFCDGAVSGGGGAFYDGKSASFCDGKLGAGGGGTLFVAFSSSGGSSGG